MSGALSLPFRPIGKEITVLDPDQRLMMRVKAGDDDAFEELMVRHQRSVLNLVYRFTGNAEQAEDLAQEVFLRLYRAAPRYEPRARFFTYLYQITLNLCRNVREREGRRQAQSLENEPEAQGVPPEESCLRHEMAIEVHRAIATLPHEQRELLVLQRFQDLGYEELSQITGQTVSAVKAKLHRARLALKKKLEGLWS